MEQNSFLNKLSADARQNFDYIESKTGHSKRFLNLMNNPTNKDFPHFTEAEIKFLGDEDLVTFAAIYRGEASLYTDTY